MSKPTNTAMPVGKILDIDGNRLMFTRKYSYGLGTFQSFQGMRVYLGDLFETDKFTMAVIEFDTGGRAGISPGTKVKVVGQREIDVVGNQFLVKAGKMWAKIDRQKSQLQIQTSGGAMGIEG